MSKINNMTNKIKEARKNTSPQCVLSEINDDNLLKVASDFHNKEYSPCCIAQCLKAIRDHAYSVGYRHGKEDADDA